MFRCLSSAAAYQGDPLKQIVGRKEISKACAFANSYASKAVVGPGSVHAGSKELDADFRRHDDV
jgi:hypothetical protein